VSDGVIYGNYFLLGRLAQGEMAEVFLGKHLDNSDPDQLLAIKRMLPRFTEDLDFASMFSDEARLAASLSHPNICKVFDQGEYAGQLFVAMEFIHGKDLKVAQRRCEGRGEPIPFRLVAHIIAKIAEALDYAHRKTNGEGALSSVIHHDVSPQNILISYDGIPKLIDFGIARARERAVKSRLGAVKGKFAYMSPEQVTGRILDGRSDIFSLGVVLYELLTGELPFKETSDVSVREKIARAKYAPPQELNSSIPRRLAAVVERAMAREPNQRYSCGMEMAADLERHLADENREVSASGLSAYTRKLFREDYIREMPRIKTFLSIDPRTTTAEEEAERDGDRRRRSTDPDRVLIEKTDITPSQFLAAGYDASPEASAEADASLENAPSGEVLLSAADVMVEVPPRLTDKPAPFATRSEGETFETTQTLTPIADDPTPVQESLWEGAGGPTTDEILRPFVEALRELDDSPGSGALATNLADELEPANEPEPVLDAEAISEPDVEPGSEDGDSGRDPAIHTDRVQGFAEDEEPEAASQTLPRFPASVPPEITAPGAAIAQDGSEEMFEAKTVEISTQGFLATPEMAALIEQHRSSDTRGGGEARRKPGPTDDVGRRIDAESLEQERTMAFTPDEAESVEPSQVVNQSAAETGSPSGTLPGAREFSNKELEAIIEEVTDKGATNPHVPAVPESVPDALDDLSPDDFDDVLTKAETHGVQKATTEPTRALKTPSGKHEAKARPSPVEPQKEQSARKPTPAPAGKRRRGRMLTDAEIAMLILAAAIGIVAVVGTYYYATTMPLERPHAMSAPPPGAMAAALTPNLGPTAGADLAEPDVRYL
jgi:serine/threonine protein kinase